MMNANTVTIEMDAVRAYEKTIADITAEECGELREWVAKGNSIYSNPHFIYDGTGRLMDFISARRIAMNMVEHPEDYYWPESTGGGIDSSEGEGD